MTDQDRREKFEELCELANNFDLEEYCKKEKKEKKDPDDRWNENYQNMLKYVQRTTINHLHKVINKTTVVG
jgi:hypothetical protein